MRTSCKFMIIQNGEGSAIHEILVFRFSESIHEILYQRKFFNTYSVQVCVNAHAEREGEGKKEERESGRGGKGRRGEGRGGEGRGGEGVAHLQLEVCLGLVRGDGEGDGVAKEAGAMRWEHSGEVVRLLVCKYTYNYHKKISSKELMHKP